MSTNKLNPAWWTLARRLLRLVLAAVLLWFDLRLFLLYLFLIVLRVWESLDHLRAVARMQSTIDHCRWIALARHLDITYDAVMQTVYDIRAGHHDLYLEGLAHDWSIATGQAVSVDDLFRMEGAGQIYLRREARDFGSDT